MNTVLDAIHIQRLYNFYLWDTLVKRLTQQLLEGAGEETMLDPCPSHTHWSPVSEEAQSEGAL